MREWGEKEEVQDSCAECNEACRLMRRSKTTTTMTDEGVESEGRREAWDPHLHVYVWFFMGLAKK